MVGAFSSWVSTPATGSAAAAAKDRESIQARAQQLYDENPQVHFWNERITSLTATRDALLVAADGMMKFIAAEDEANQGLMDVSEAMMEFSNVLAAAPPFEWTRNAAAGNSSLLADIAEIHRTDADKRFTQVYEVILYESSYMDALVDAIEFCTCLWRRKIESDLDKYQKPGEQQAFSQYVCFVDARLKEEVFRNFQRHGARMKQMMKKFGEIPLAALTQEDLKTAHHPFLALSRSPKYNEFGES
jgi:hypothetical protein